MLATRFKLPPLEGDDVAMLMERDMLRRWGFLGKQKDKAAKANSVNDSGTTLTIDRDRDSSSNTPSENGTEFNSEDSDEEDQQNKDTVLETENKCQDSNDRLEENKEKSPGTEDEAEVKGERNEEGVVDAQDDVSENCGGYRHENENSLSSEPDANAMVACMTQDVTNTTTKNENDLENCTKTEEEAKQEEGVSSVHKQSSGLDQNDRCKREMSGDVLVLYHEACRHYEEEDYCECMLSVEEALELCGYSGGGAGGSDVDDADVEDLDMIQLWLLRAKVMNSMENYKEALRSAYKVTAKERPSRLWVEGAIAMEKLGIQVTAELWIAMGMHKWKEENATSHVTSHNQEVWDAAVDSDVMCVLKMMQNRLRVERIYGPLVMDKPLKVKASLKCNRTVHATRKIKKGEIIFKEIPDILEQSIKTHHITACAECAKSLIQPEDLISKSASKAVAPNVITDIKKGLRKIWPKLKVVRCSFCREVKYCSDDCRKKSWENYHKVICPSNEESTAAMLYDVRRSFRDVIAADGSSWQGWWNAEFSPTLLSRMTSTVLCKANLLADLRAQENYSEAHWSMCEAILEKYSSCDKMHATDQVPKMQELLNSIFKRSKFLRFEITRKIFDKQYSQALTNVIRFHDTAQPMNDFASRVKLENEKLFKKIKKNDEQCLKKPTVAEFHGLFPLASCLNHSCYPNAVIESAPVEDRPGILIKALRDIREGEEVFISYVDPLMERHERRKILWRKYKFVCECPRCLHQGIGPHVCTNCGKTTQDAPEPKDSSAKTDQDGAANTDEEIKTGASQEETMGISGNSEHKEITQQLNSDIIQQIPSQDCLSSNFPSSEFSGNDNNVADDDILEVSSSGMSRSVKCDEDDEVWNDKCTESYTQGLDKSGDDNDKEIYDKEDVKKNNNTDVEKNNNTHEHDDESARGDAKTECQQKIEENSGSGDAKCDDKSPNTISTESKLDNNVVKFAACGRCKKAWYCSVQCQKDSWISGHKRICSAPA